MKPLIQFKKTTPTLFIPLAVICFGLAPMAQAVGPDTEGSILGSNNGEGVGVLVSRTSGVWNTGTGFEALNHLTSGNQNTATGLRALFSDINGGFNTATGVYSLYFNTSGFFNNATGAYSLTNNTTGNENTANGYSALYSNTTGGGNTAIGFAALRKNTTGTLNVAIGDDSMFNNVVGSFNVAIGEATLSNADSVFNTAVGFEAGQNLTTSSENIYLGDTAGTLDNTGASPGDEFGVIRIGSVFSGTAACFINGIYLLPAGPAPLPVMCGSDGKLSANPSSRRFKHDIKPIDKASEVILALKPVTFHYNNDATNTLDFGLIAEDVDEVSPDLVVRDKEGKPLSVRYEGVNAMLLNEFLKEHKKVEEQQSKIDNQQASIAELKATVAQQAKGMEVLTAQLKEQAAQIQKVSAQLEVSKPATKVVVNKP